MPQRLQCTSFSNDRECEFVVRWIESSSVATDEYIEVATPPSSTSRSRPLRRLWWWLLPSSTLDIVLETVVIAVVASMIYSTIWGSSSSSMRPSTPVLVVLGAMLLVRVVYRANSVCEERLSIIRDVGIQLTTVYESGHCDRVFIERSHIKELLMVEGFRRLGVIYFLAFEPFDSHKKLILAFQHCIPRFASLEKIYHTSRAILSLPD